MYFPSRQRALKRPGPRRMIHISLAAKAALGRAAAEWRLTERALADELLEDADLLRAAAARAAERLGEAGKARAGEYDAPG